MYREREKEREREREREKERDRKREREREIDVIYFLNSINKLPLNDYKDQSSLHHFSCL